MDIAKTGVMISTRCSAVSGYAAMAVSLCASGCGTATAVIVWRLRGRLRRVWRGAARGYAGSWRLVRPRGAGPWVCVSRMDSGCSHSSRVPVPSGTHAKPGDSSNPCALSSWSNLDGRGTRRRAAGMATACAAESRWSRARDGSPRRNGAVSWCMRANWRSSTRRHIPPRKRRTPQQSLRTSRRGKPSGLPVRRMPKPLSRRMRAGARDGAVALHPYGGLMRSALRAWQRRAVRAAPVEAVQRSRTHPQPSQGIASWERLRP
jgi:hypothetical protein